MTTDAIGQGLDFMADVQNGLYTIRIQMIDGRMRPARWSCSMERSWEAIPIFITPALTRQKTPNGMPTRQASDFFSEARRSAGVRWSFGTAMTAHQSAAETRLQLPIPCGS